MQTSFMRDEEIYQVLGQQIAARRKALRMTQGDLAEQVKMSRASVANIERGRQSVLLHHLYRFAEALEVSKVADLVPQIAVQPQVREDLLAVPFSMDISESSKALMTSLLANEMSQRKSKS